MDSFKICSNKIFDVNKLGFVYDLSSIRVSKENIPVYSVT